MGHIRVDPSNTNNKWVGFGLANVDTFIIRVGFELTNVDTIYTLTRHEHDPLTRIATPINDYSHALSVYRSHHQLHMGWTMNSPAHYFINRPGPARCRSRVHCVHVGLG